MATFQEIVNLRGSPDWDTLRNKVQVAAIIKAQAISEATTPSAELKSWARSALTSPQTVADVLTYYVVADNSSVPIANIISANDTAIQSAVNKAVDSLFGVA